MVKATYEQTYIGIWFHGNNFLPDLRDKMKLCLNRTFYYYRIFASEEDFYKYIDEEQLVARIFLIISTIDSSLDCLVQLTEQYPKIFEKIYIFPSTNNRIPSCFTTNSMDDLFKEINKNVQNYVGALCSSSDIENETCTRDIPLNTSLADNLPPSLSVFNLKPKTNTPIRHVTKESLRFLCFLRMADILLRIQSYRSEDLLEMWASFRDLYKENSTQLDYIDDLEEIYDESEAIKYYTGDSCLSRSVNQACHTENMRQIFTCRVYIRDLHKQLADRHEQNLTPLIEKVYRGKPLSVSVLQQLIDNVGGLVSMNGFLSTTVIREVASHYHGDEQVSKVRAGYKPVLFVFRMNTPINQPYAYIGNCSTKPDEAEILFSLGTIWRINSVKINEDPCIVELSSYNELDLQSIEMLKQSTGNECDLSSIGDIFLELGDDDEAEWFYRKMLKQTYLDDETKRSLYYKIGKIRFERRDYPVALKYFEDAVNLLPPRMKELDEIVAPRLRCVCDDQSPFITMYINMGIIYEEGDQFKEALSYYKRAVKIKNESESMLATAHNYLGLLYFRLKKYEEARDHHKKTVELIDEGDSNWIEFRKNLENANQRCQHLMEKKQIDNNVTNK